MSFDESAITVSWEEGSVDRVANRELRANCRYARCTDEFSGEQLYLSRIPADVRVDEVRGSVNTRWRWQGETATPPALPLPPDNQVAAGGGGVNSLQELLIGAATVGVCHGLSCSMASARTC
ncbi:MAG: gamma-butyrobetaine hydroxylase-like domain-containing protein [Spirochaetaceae bacterium]|nr:gamma-butyrobetaine hydroxylase-like domain-containing protein [Spirochaetaceae bacterium]